jgi:hypothetical protein
MGRLLEIIRKMRMKTQNSTAARDATGGKQRCWFGCRCLGRLVDGFEGLSGWSGDLQRFGMGNGLEAVGSQTHLGRSGYGTRIVPMARTK